MIDYTLPLMNGRIDYNILTDVFSLPNKLINEYKDILKTNFGIEKTSTIVDIKVGISKGEIKNHIIQNYPNTLFSKAYISSTMIKISEVRTVINETIFEDKENYNGWLIFIDKSTMANWAHDCEYIFAINEEILLKSKIKTDMPPRDNVEIEEVNT